MTITQVIEKLEEYKEQHGDIDVRVAGVHDAWGTMYNQVDEFTLKVIDNTRLNPKRHDNPETGTDTKAVVFCYGYDV